MSNDSPISSVDIIKYQTEYNKIFRKLNINFYSISAYNLSIIYLCVFLHRLHESKDVTSIVLLITCAASLILREDKQNVIKLISYAKEKGIEQEDIDEVVTKLLSFKTLFTNVSVKFGKKIDNLIDMISYTELFIPFMTIIISLVDQKMIDIEFISNPTFSELTIYDEKYKYLLNRILHKLLIVVSNTSKFQDVKNTKILRINDELKADRFKNPRIQM